MVTFTKPNLNRRVGLWTHPLFRSQTKHGPYIHVIYEIHSTNGVKSGLKVFPQEYFSTVTNAHAQEFPVPFHTILSILLCHRQKSTQDARLQRKHLRFQR